MHPAQPGAGAGARARARSGGAPPSGSGEGAKKPLDAAQMHLGVSVGYMAIKAYWRRCGAVEGDPTVPTAYYGLGLILAPLLPRAPGATAPPTAQTV